MNTQNMNSTVKDAGPVFDRKHYASVVGSNDLKDPLRKIGMAAFHGFNSLWMLMRIKPTLSLVKDAFEVITEQAILIAVIAYPRMDYPKTEEGIKDYLRVKEDDYPRWLSELETLCDRRFITRERSNSQEKSNEACDVFVINPLFEQSLVPDLTLVDKRLQTPQDLVEALFRAFGCLDSTELTFDTTQESVKTCLDENGHLAPVAKMKSFGLNEFDETLLWYFVICKIKVSQDKFDTRDIDSLGVESYRRKKFRNEIIAGRHILQRKGLIQTHKGKDKDKTNSDSFSLSKKVLNDVVKLFGEEYVGVEFDDGDGDGDGGKHYGTFIMSDSINEKSLYFNESSHDDIMDLYILLQKEKFEDFERRSFEHLGKKGLTCLFYGSPGTGKTELALQLARSSGRDILKLDCTDYLNQWMGNSEANLRNALDEYHNLCLQGGVKPILLLNEADSILFRRTTTISDAGDVAYNSLQNILLQGFESQEGIIIATTNLETNLDPAYERRFLKKIKFGNPDAETRGLIWANRFPHLSVGEVETLADNYELSGAQIDNVLSRYILQETIRGEGSVGYSDIVRFCREESRKVISK